MYKGNPGKSILARGSARFTLVRVRVIGSQLHNTFHSVTFLEFHTYSKYASWEMPKPHMHHYKIN